MARLVALLLLAGCSATHRAQVQDNRARAGLAEAASAYWEAVRWNNPQAASTFLDTPEARLGLLKLVDAHTVRLSDAEVRQVDVGPEITDPASLRRREGVALVRVEAYAAAGTRLVQDTIEQHWAQSAAGAWFVDTAKSPVTEDRLW